MKRSIIIFISFFLVSSFSFLLYKAYINKRGEPSGVREEEIAMIIPFRERIVNILERPDPSIWDNINGRDIKLTYQATLEPWGSGLVPELNVKAFHNGRDIYFRLSYKDSTLNESISIDKFSDGAAIMFPVNDEIKPENIMMGFQGRVNIWHWRALEDKVWRAGETQSPVTDLISEGIGTLTKKKTQRVAGRGFRSEDGWEVIFSRSLSAVDGDAVDFLKTKKILVAFAVFDGDKGDRGPRKSISSFIEMRIEKKD